MKRSRKRMLKAAGNAAGWVRTAAAAKSGTAKQRAKYKARGFFSSHAPGPVKHISPASTPTEAAA